MKLESVRTWFDVPQPMGLTREVQNLVLLVFAEQSGRRFCRSGIPVRAEELSLTRLDDVLELREQKLPSKADWERAVARAKTILDLSPSPHRTAGNVADLAEKAREAALRDRKDCQALTQRLRDRLTHLDIDPSTSDRLRTAAAVSSLLERVSQEEGGAVIAALVAGDAVTSEDAMGKSRREAAAVVQRLASTNWALLDEARQHAGEDPEAAAVRDDLTAVLTRTNW
jgi:hypothetical protein